jgi:hypothetical protein
MGFAKVLRNHRAMIRFTFGRAVVGRGVLVFVSLAPGTDHMVHQSPEMPQEPVGARRRRLSSDSHSKRAPRKN